MNLKEWLFILDFNSVYFSDDFNLQISIFNISSQAPPFQAKVSFKSFIPNIMILKHLHLTSCPFYFSIYCFCYDPIPNMFIKSVWEEWPNLQILFIIKASTFRCGIWKKEHYYKSVFRIQNSFSHTYPGIHGSKNPRPAIIVHSSKSSAEDSSVL